MKQKKSLTSVQTSFSSKSNQSYAPFGSVSLRSKKKKKKDQRQQVGPGAYDISLPIVKPIIQTFTKKNNNIIVKLAHIGTSSFQGDRDRFANQSHLQDQYNQKVGPGMYSPQKSLAYLESSVVDKSAEYPQRKYAGLELAKYIKHRQRRAATFTEIKRIEIDDYVQMPALQGKQQKQKSQNNNSISRIKGAAWSMMKQKRIRSLKNPYANLGPGKYYVDEFARKQTMKSHQSISEEYSAFKSESVRSFFDMIKFETHKDTKALLRQASGYKSDSLGPGAYQIQKKHGSGNRFQFFGSTVERI